MFLIYSEICQRVSVRSYAPYSESNLKKAMLYLCMYIDFPTNIGHLMWHTSTTINSPLSVMQWHHRELVNMASYCTSIQNILKASFFSFSFFFFFFFFFQILAYQQPYPSTNVSLDKISGSVLIDHLLLISVPTLGQVRQKQLWAGRGLLHWNLSIQNCVGPKLRNVL